MVYGVGISDVVGVHTNTNGKRIRCQYHLKWNNMLKRCYSTKYHETHPTYKDCVVCDEWLIFSNFKTWAIQYNMSDMELDKDIIFPNNKTYSPETCCFVPRELNQLFSGYDVGKHPKGVTFKKANDKYCSQINIDGKRKYIGLFDTVCDARIAYLMAKVDLVKAYYGRVPKRVRKGLKKHIKLIKEEIKNGREKNYCSA